MSFRRLAIPRPLSVALLVLAALLALAALPRGSDGPASAQAASTGSLRSAIDASKRREAQLGSAAARLGRLERQATRAIAVLQGRLNDAQAELSRAESRLADTEARLRAARSRHVRLRTRLTQVRTKLSDVLRARYETGQLDWTDVVLQAQSFAALQERLEFLHRVQSRNSSLLSEVRAAKIDALAERRTYARLLPGRRAAAEAVRSRRDSLAQINAGLQARRAALAQARGARLAALTATRAGRRSAQHRLTKVLAEQERAARRAAVSMVGPGGPWAIPWAIVQCESGGQNVGPNYAGASGYYQFMVATWKGLGGSTPQAYQASKAEQDRLAARLWDHGRGARNWDCAAIVGITG
jgi:peptidoglycan hydrolase CwlO-like protein